MLPVLPRASRKLGFKHGRNVCQDRLRSPRLMCKSVTNIECPLPCAGWHHDFAGAGPLCLLDCCTLAQRQPEEPGYAG
eukprot:1159475-Pelagomonas_calceolata.AAC.7